MIGFPRACKNSHSEDAWLDDSTWFRCSFLLQILTVTFYDISFTCRYPLKCYCVLPWLLLYLIKIVLSCKLLKFFVLRNSKIYLERSLRMWVFTTILEVRFLRRYWINFEITKIYILCHVSQFYNFEVLFKSCASFLWIIQKWNQCLFNFLIIANENNSMLTLCMQI